MAHDDKHNNHLYFGPSIPNAFECSIPNNIFHGPSCSLALDVLMVFSYGTLPFIPILDCNLHNSFSPLSMDLSSPL